MILFVVELRPKPGTGKPFSWVGLTHKGARILVKRRRNAALLTRDEARAIVADLQRDVKRGVVPDLGEVVVETVDCAAPLPGDLSRRNPETL